MKTVLSILYLLYLDSFITRSLTFLFYTPSSKTVIARNKVTWQSIVRFGKPKNVIARNKVTWQSITALINTCLPKNRHPWIASKPAVSRNADTFFYNASFHPSSIHLSTKLGGEPCTH